MVLAPTVNTAHSYREVIQIFAVRYIERFRHGTPMSREDRQKKGMLKKEDFWWLQKEPVHSQLEPSESSTPKSGTAKTRGEIKPQAARKQKASEQKAKVRGSVASML